MSVELQPIDRVDRATYAFQNDAKPQFGEPCVSERVGMNLWEARGNHCPMATGPRLPQGRGDPKAQVRAYVSFFSKAPSTALRRTSSIPSPYPVAA